MEQRRYRLVSLIVVVSVLAFLLPGGAMPAWAAVTSVTLANPGAGTYGEDDDYFTTVWGNPRDMDEKADLYVLNSTCATSATANWQSTSLGGGKWSGITGSIAGASRYLWVLNPGWSSSLDTGEDGQARPVDAGRYTQLTFRMYSSQGGGTAHLGYTRGETSHPPYNAPFAVFQGWSIYTMDLRDLGDWTGGITGMVLQFHSLPSGIEIKLDWVRLTPRQNRQIRWTSSGPSGNVAVYLGSDQTFSNPEEYGRLRVYEGSLYETPASTGVLTLPASLPGGAYYARVVDNGGGATSPSAWTFQEMPIAQILTPSYTSGEDWATTVTGNPWDMAGTDDVYAAESREVTYSASDGVLHITNIPDGPSGCYEPWPHRTLALNLHGRAIDTNRYKYFSFRYKLDQAPDQGAGSVTRVRWQIPSGNWPTGRTDDISIYDNGWNVYKLDLSTVRLEVEGAQWTDLSYRILQILVNESHSAWTSHLDWAMLTAENVARSSYVVMWEMLQGHASTTTLYWDTDRNPANGFAGPGYQVAAAPADPPPGPHLIYLPLVARNHAPGQHAFTLSTGGLAYGATYYVALKLEDGYNTVYWYSELPVRRIP